MSLLHHPIGYCLGWTFVHSLWQGLLVGLLTWATTALARRRSAELRYTLACFAMLLMVAGSAATFLRVWESLHTVADRTWLVLSVPGIRDWAGGGRGLFWIRMDQYLPLLAVAWVLGAAGMAARLASGLIWIQAVCLRRSQPADPVWEARLLGLGRAMKIPGGVSLRVSSHLDSPVVLGWIRPVILVPASVLAGMDAPSLEAILLHELAHIRRWDYPVNLLQNLAEVLFFYHPALWWISRQIRRERENCCDDLAAARCGDPLRYASALAALEALRIPPTHSIRLAPAAKGGSLMLRIRRLIAPKAPVASAPALLSFASTLAAGAIVALLALPLQARWAEDSRQASPAPEGTQVAEVEFSKVRIRHQPPAPAYPADAKAKGIQGTVVVKVFMDTEGVPTRVVAFSGPMELRPTAEEYARAWRFEPYQENGRAVPAAFLLFMPFNLM